MATTGKQWDELGKQLSELGLKLKLHHEQAAGDDDKAHDGAATALHALRDALDNAFTAIGAAAKDQAVKADVKEVGRSLTEALQSTFGDVSEKLKSAFHRDN
jgi:Flp pilus assembly pilin Flp